MGFRASRGVRLFFVGQILFGLGLKAHDEDNPFKNEYERKLLEVNHELDLLTMSGDNSCPITSLITTCGDGYCDGLEENVDSCPGDCVIALVKSYNTQISCEKVQEVEKPKTVSEIQSIIVAAREKNLPVRTVGNRHSANRQYCNDGIAISTEKLGDVIGIERQPDGSEVVTVEPGVTLGDLGDWLHKRGRTLGYAYLGFRKATVAGAIANGAHGSSPKHTAVISSLVRGITIVTAEGDVVLVDETSGDLLRALRAHLGLLGVVVQIKLAIVPQFKLHMRLTYHDHDELFRANGLLDAVKDCDYAFINWFPSEERFIRGCGQETNRVADRGAQNVLLKPSVPPGLIMPYKTALHYGMCYHWVNSLLESLRYLFFVWQPPLQKDGFWGWFGDPEHTTDLVGYSHNIISSDFSETEEQFFENDREIAVPMALAENALLGVHDIIKNSYAKFPVFGMFLRFAKSEDKTLLAHTTSVGSFKKDELVVFFEMVTPEPIGFPAELKAVVDQPFETISTYLITEHHGRPHWAKNKPTAFSLAHDLHVYGENLDIFQTIMKGLDANGMFTNEFFQRFDLGKRMKRSPK